MTDLVHVLERWLLSDACRRQPLSPVFDELCCRLHAGGVPLWRANLGISTLHPLIVGYGVRWWREQSSEREDFLHDDHEDAYRASPIYPVVEHGATARHRLGPEPAALPLLERFRRQGATDYLAVPLLVGSGERFPLSFATDAPDGFTEAQLAVLQGICPALGLLVDAKSSAELASNLLVTYLGRAVGEQVFQGRIRRGDGERFQAVVWYSDLRGFTSLSEQLDTATLLALLNSYFEVVGAAVGAQGGTVVDMIGDAATALFRVEGNDPGPAAAATVAAALDAQQRAAALRADGLAALRFGIGLDLGPVTHGNVGAPDRLSFNVVGAPINRAARLEGLTKTAGADLVFSRSVAEACGRQCRSLGLYSLRGVAEEQEAFALSFPYPGFAEGGSRSGPAA